jgi:hypothetical protein
VRERAVTEESGLGWPTFDFFEAEFDKLVKNVFLCDPIATGKYLDSPGLVVITHDRVPG